jgi:hypothetical protein
MAEIDPQTAQRLVTRWVVNEIGNMLMGGTPYLIVDEQTVWRIPVMLGSSQKGILGQVGTVDVGAETGELRLSDELAQEILQAAQQLVLTVKE